MSVLSPPARIAAVAVAAVLLAGCSTRKAPTVLPPVSAPGAAVVRTATSLVGSPYRDGGQDPSGFDCSGFVHYVFAQHGIAAPRDVRRQWQWGVTVRREDIRAGDLLFFSTKGQGPTHVTLAIDGDRFVHAPSARGVVRIESLTSAYWARRFVGARRQTASGH
jgi:cell wall-associated NlpC family hydrolase